MTPDTAAVERVARAIYEAHGFSYEHRTVLASGKPYDHWAKAVAAAERVLALSPPEGEVPRAWLYVMTYETGETNEQLTLERGNPFGKPGVDYSAEYEVTETPLYTASPVPPLGDGK